MPEIDMRAKTLSIAVALAILGTPVMAAGSIGPSAGMETESWADLRDEVYGDRAIEEAASGVVTLDVPYRAADDRRVPMSASVAFDDGRTVKSLTLIIDENPMPISAAFEMSAPREAFSATVAMRLNGPSNVRAVVEASDGQLYMTSAFVKTSGLGACAAPPITGVEEALASLGGMDLKGTGAGSALDRVKAAGTGEATLDILHPQHSGMQMDQISLLYIPARYIETVEAWGDDEKLFTMTGSISLSEDPSIAFSSPDGATEMRVRMTDTDEAVFEKRFPLGGA
jgi:sulfur-oxidizing protein SoxY